MSNVRTGGSHSFTPREMMTIAAARMLTNEDVCLVGIGAPSAACNLARLTHAPGVKLIYESGTIGTCPDVLPLSIGDGELCEKALSTVSLPEMFRYWIQGGRISVGFLGAAEIDRKGNLNTTVIGDYHKPEVRLPGAGGAPEIAAGCRKMFVIIEMSKRRFVEKVSFVTTSNDGRGRLHRGEREPRSQKVITDLCLMDFDPRTSELVVTSIHPGVEREEIQAQCGWQLSFAEKLIGTPPPKSEELETLRDLLRRTEISHKNENP